MDRYNIIHGKNRREIVLLKGFPCVWGKCSFCDYIDDNSRNENEINNLNICLLYTSGGTIHRILNSNMALLRGKYVNIIPFYEIIRFIIKKGNYERLIQFFLNILICMPIGILLPLVFSERNWNLKKIFNITTIITFSVEVIQYFTGRMADVDDLSLIHI